MSRKNSSSLIITVFLCMIIASLVFLNVEKSRPFDVQRPFNIQYDRASNTIHLDSLTLKQKIAQMTIAYGHEEDASVLQKMFVGGVYLPAKSSRQEFLRIISSFQDSSIVPMFMTVDMEGCINPFENFKKFPALNEIKTSDEAYNIGNEEGKILRDLGFSINFAPVVDLKDNIWKCRSFLGTPEEISIKASAYISGIQQNGIIATSKHYPGKTLSIEDLHKSPASAFISDDDLLPFSTTISNNVSAIMVSHVIATGSVDSESKPAVVSENLIYNLRSKFNGLIVTDDIKMSALQMHYPDQDQLYIDLFKSGNDLILNFNSPEEIYHMVSVVEQAVENGDIDENRIDESIARILRAKGMNVAS